MIQLNHAVKIMQNSKFPIRHVALSFEFVTFRHIFGIFPLFFIKFARFIQKTPTYRLLLLLIPSCDRNHTFAHRNTPPPRRGGGPQDRRGFPPTYSICKSDISVITPRGCESPALRCAARSPARRDGFVTRTCMFSFDVSAFLLALFASFSPYLRFYRILANFRFDVFLVLRHFASLFVRLRHL